MNKILNWCCLLIGPNGSSFINIEPASEIKDEGPNKQSTK